MEVEDRLLLYTVVLGAAFGLFSLLRRRAYSFWVHCVVLALLMTGALGALWLRYVGRIDQDMMAGYAQSLIVAFVLLALLPSVGLILARKLASARRNGWAAVCASSAAALLGFPLPIRREAQFYAALAAAERGDEDECAARLERLAAAGALPSVSGGALLATVLPPAGARRWPAVLEALEGQLIEGNVLRVVEAKAAAETGDLPRALHAYRVIDDRVPPGAQVRQQARRVILACAGRTTFLTEAREQQLPVMAGARGDADLVVARSLEAEGRLEEALREYQQASRTTRGRFQRDALEGIARCEGGRPRLALGVGLDLTQILDLEDACRAEARGPERATPRAVASATLWISAVTTLASVLAWTLAGMSAEEMLASGALSAPLIAHDGEWWRLFMTMFLHGGVVHLVMNIGSILVVGIPLERRIGAARTIVIYVLSGLSASIGSVLINDTLLGVGASGAAMGLFGAFGAVLLMRRELFHPVERTRWLNVLWVTALATAVVGALEHQAMDNAAHGVGLLAGAAIGWGLLRERRPAGLAVAATAVMLVMLQATATVVTVLESGTWLQDRVVRTAGVSAHLPGWLRARETAGGLIAARAPFEFRLQIGAVGRHRPDPRRLVAGLTDPAVDRALEGAPVSTREDVLADRRGAWPLDVSRFIVQEDGQARDPSSSQVARFELGYVEHGGAFLLIFLRLPPDDQGGAATAWGMSRERLTEILASLRTTDG